MHKNDSCPAMAANGYVQNQISNQSNQLRFVQNQIRAKAPYSKSNPDLLRCIWGKSDIADRFL